MKKENFICFDLFKRISSKTSHKTKRNLSLLAKQQTAHQKHRNASHQHNFNMTQKQFFNQQKLQIFGRSKNRKPSDFVGRMHNGEQDFQDLKGWSISQQQQNRQNSNRNQIFFKIKRRPENIQKPKRSFLHINTTPHLDSKPLNNIERKLNFQQPVMNQTQKTPRKPLFTSRNNAIYNKENQKLVDYNLRCMNQHKMVHNFQHLTRFQNWIKTHLRLQQNDFQQ